MHVAKRIIGLLFLDVAIITITVLNFAAARGSSTIITTKGRYQLSSDSSEYSAEKPPE